LVGARTDDNRQWFTAERSFAWLGNVRRLLIRREHHVSAYRSFFVRGGDASVRQALGGRAVRLSALCAGVRSPSAYPDSAYFHSLEEVGFTL
jgi:hypothetical protein